MNLTGNVVTGNRIGVNNLRTSEGDAQTTGVYLGDASPLVITVEGNTIPVTTTASSPRAARSPCAGPATTASST